MPANAASKPKSRPVLELDRNLGSKKELMRIRDNFSAIALAGDHLWLGGDEGTCIDRMTRDARGNFGNHVRFDLGKVLSLPVSGDEPQEIDIEGLDWDRGYLWLVGSHSRKRKQPEEDKSRDKNRERLAKVESEGNRHTLARVPLNENFEPVTEQGTLRAARLEGDAKDNLLSRALAADPHTGPFCMIPSKDNGLDIEGLTVRRERVFVGLRGPVLRGWSVVLEFEVKESSPGVLTLAVPLRKHFLQLDGLGVRELAILGKDLFILAGPTMNLDGPVFIFRWPKALDNRREALLYRNELRKVLAVPFGTGISRGRDHAEGIALMDGKGSLPDIMISYDSPSEMRLDGKGRVRADVFRLSQKDIDS
jgi:hypothetical protein